MRTKKILFFGILLFIISHYSVFAETKIANDPSQLSVGARVLGMGKAFTAIANDPAAIFMNPAGLGQIDKWQFSSMSGKYINEFDYVQIATVYPTQFGVFGIGYGGSSLEFTTPSSETITIGDDTRIVPTGEVQGKYANTALLLSYGNRFDFWKIKNLYLGGTLKMLSQELSATGISTSGTASGGEMNLGLLYPVFDDLTVAVYLENALPANMSGEITWSTGTYEYLPATLKIGIAQNILGEKGTIPHEQELTIALDIDSYPSRTNLASTSHIGIEWAPNERIDLRAGIDQQLMDSSGSISNTNLSFGVGVLFRGFRFDYCYHTYNDLPNNTTNYFSVSYGIWRKGPPEKMLVKIISPADKSTLYEEKTIITGKIQNPDVKKVVIQTSEAEIKKNLTFSAEVNLKLGKNPILVQAYDEKGRLLQKYTHKILRLSSFSDVKKDYWARLPVSQLATLGIISGYPNKTFRPHHLISRAEITTLLLKLKGFKAKPLEKKPFKDIPKYHWAAYFIEEAVEQKLITGYPDKTFRPAKAISRAEGITLISRFAELPKARLLESPYKDVPGRHWAAEKVTEAKEAGFLDYIDTDYFYPKQKITRGESAYILSKTKYVKPRISNLMDFNSGYEE